jgi:hypothetical protein
MTEQTRVIEVNGVKLEVDLRDARVIDQFKVGDSVKILVASYSDKYTSHLGVIVGFDDFKNRPTIIVAYLEVDYNGATIKFAYIHKDSKDVEIAPINTWDVPFKKHEVVDKIDKEIAKKEGELKELESKKQYFLHMFGKYFEDHENQ